jgi:hypothetical protein
MNTKRIEYEIEINKRTGIYTKAILGIGSYMDMGNSIGPRYAFAR